ncbi:hypothetical protein BDP27DRAFT_1403793 [Rhodocollybia butyracea]|uniref:F-box domain-containing protein n=1 Tax=Rhodocollybia butyracea TaxID=206335 RepID=A0A9P5PKM1_9AGAR|nr:hypothetical protein BDP27DRAFT_1403793 [Rhodocollybia butyracea]
MYTQDTSLNVKTARRNHGYGYPYSRNHPYQALVVEERQTEKGLPVNELEELEDFHCCIQAGKRCILNIYKPSASMAWFQNHIPSLSWKRSTSTAYINQLPNELLLIIFHHVCSETPGNDVGLGLSKEVGKDPAPSHSRATDLSCVCVLWGRVIISEPILWTNFRLVYPASSSAVSRVPVHLGHFRQFVDTLQSHVTRSRGLPLTIEVLILSKDPDTSAEAVRLLFHLASRHIRRLRIQAPEAALVKSGTVELPLLEELEILHAKDPSIALLLTDTPRLHSLHTHFALPRAANTTTLSLDIYLCFGGVNRIYDLFPNLSSLSVFTTVVTDSNYFGQV